MSRPAAILPARWRELVDNAGRFIDRWAVQAALSATIRTNGGATLTFRRTPPAPGQHAVAIWELCVEPVEASGA
jgi:hypothetical protein